MRTGKRWLAGLLCLVMLLSACAASLADKKEEEDREEGFKVTFYGRNGGRALYTWRTDKDGKLNRALRPTTRRGYHFMGWFSDPYEGYRITEKTVFKRHASVWAHWASVEGKDIKEPGVYSVVFLEDENSRTLPSGVLTGEDGKLAEIPEPNFEKKKDKVILGWRDRNTRELITADTVFTEDTKAVAIWGSTAGATLTFISDNCLYGQREYRRGAWVTSLPDPPAEDKLKKRDFLGWFTEPEGGERVTGLHMMENRTLYAHWSEPGWTVTFSGAYPMTETGELIARNRLRTDTEGRLESVPGGVVRQARFDGWYLDRRFTVPLTEDTVFTRNTKVWARTERSGNVLVRLDVDTYGSGRGKTVPVILQVLPGEPAGVLPQPSWTADNSERRKFLGWFAEDGTPVTADTVFTENTTLFARWAEGFRITFADSGEPSFKAAYTDENGRLAELPAGRKMKQGNPPLGWYTAQGEKVTTDTVFTADTELVPGWGHRVQFYLDRPGSFSNLVADTSTDGEGKLSVLPKAHHPRHYPFAGWVDQAGNPVTEDTVYTADTTVFGTWETEGVRIDFVGGLGGLSDTTVMMTRNDGTVEKLPEAHHIQRGLPFLGWSSEPDGSAPVTDQTVFTARYNTLYAIWLPVNKVTFRPNAGRVADGSKAILTDTEGNLPELPEAEHPLKLPFKGWYEGSRKVTPETKILKDVWLDARWGKPEEKAGGYTVTLDDRGKTLTLQTEDNGWVKGLPSPERSDATFFGWYTGPAATGMRLRNYSWVGGDVTAYAAWLIPLTEEEDRAR